MYNHEAVYVGSFIQIPGVSREKDFFIRRTMQQIHEDHIHDADIRAIYHAVKVAYEHGDLPTPEVVADIMLESKSFDNLSLNMQEHDTLVEQIVAVGKRGLTKWSEFIRCEQQFYRVWQSNQIENIPKYMQKLQEKGLSPKEIAAELSRYLENVRGNFVAETTYSRWDKQAETFEQMNKLSKDRVGKPLNCFPPHWGLNNYIPNLQPGWMIVLAGATGDGKSSLAMQFAEFQAIIGKNVLVVHMEDPLETILARQTARWIPNTTLEELERGDPDDKLIKMKTIRESWPGDLVYRYMGGQASPTILLSIEEVARDMQAEGKKLDYVVLDYFQKIDFDQELTATTNVTNVANRAAENFKLLSEKWLLTTLIVSQVTPDGDGKMHTAGLRALEHKPQVYIQVHRDIIKNEKDRERFEVAPGVVKTIADIGDRSAWTRLLIKKVNQGRPGSSWVVFLGPSFKAMTPDFYKEIMQFPEKEFETPRIRPITDAYQLFKSRTFEAYDKAFNQPNPDDRKYNERKYNVGDRTLE